MKSFQLLIIIFLVFVNPTSRALCQDITLSWDQSPTPEVAGYNVYYKANNSDLPFDGVGAAEGASPIDVGNTLTTTLTNLDDDVDYFFLSLLMTLKPRVPTPTLSAPAGCQR